MSDCGNVSEAGRQTVRLQTPRERELELQVRQTIYSP